MQALTAQEMIVQLQLCNPNSPVYFAIDGCTAIPVKSVEFRSFNKTSDEHAVDFGFAKQHPCVMLFEEPTDISRYIDETGGTD